MAEFKKGNSITDGAGSETGEWTESEHPRDEAGRFVSVSEFRYIEKHADPKIEGHPAHLYAKSDDEAKYLQMTHSATITGNPEQPIEMTENPNPIDTRPAHFVPKSQTSKMTDLGKVKKSWRPLSAEDDEKMRPHRDAPFNKKK